jgi:sec-independent protein translocase protein TatB
MLDFGWPELFVIAIMAVLVIGPQDFPKVMVGVGRLFRRFQYIKYAMSQQFDDVMQQADLNHLRDDVNFEAQRASDSETFDEEAEDEAFLADLENAKDKERGDE